MAHSTHPVTCASEPALGTPLLGLSSAACPGARPRTSCYGSCLDIPMVTYGCEGGWKVLSLAGQTLRGMGSFRKGQEASGPQPLHQPPDQP